MYSVERAPPRKDRAASSASDAPFVLIVDDDPEIRDSLKDLFASVGIDAMAFESTQQLLDQPFADRPSCLVLDLRLPGAGGLELQEQLRAMKVAIPIIFITGHADVPTSVRAMKAGAIDFLPKPFREQELLDAVTQALRRDAARRLEEQELSELRSLASLLTPRETEVLQGVGRGLLNKQIAYEMGVTEITVKMHRSSAGRKLKSRSVADLVRKVEQLAL